MVTTLAVLDELQEQLLTWEREPNSREGAIIAWEDGLVASEIALGRACMEHDAERKAVQQDCLSRMCVLTSDSKHSINFSHMLEERQILLSL
jgi:hypothetical protein